MIEEESLEFRLRKIETRNLLDEIKNNDLIVKNIRRHVIFKLC